MLHIFVDADACPVKDEVYRVAQRCGLAVTLVANSRMRIPDNKLLNLEVVQGGFDAADDWIAGHAGPDDIVITADIPLAGRCLAQGARVLGSNGRPFTEDNIGSALATRELLSGLRDLGEIGGGPPPFSKRDRSLFLQELDKMIQAIRKKQGGTQHTW
ncbi:MAG: YaiI/YqxD family protein [Deltaproteobacteria bacterium]|nr:YaiI/YqxD family protein [Deltaproteobacteria bacterium]